MDRCGPAYHVENRQFASKTKGSDSKRAKKREQTHGQLGKFFPHPSRFSLANFIGSGKKQEGGQIALPAFFCARLNQLGWSLSIFSCQTSLQQPSAN
jgi:hypothetical protein